MDNLFLILFLASFVALIVGLVKPALFSRFIKGEITRKKIATIFGIAIVVSFVLFAVTTDSSKKAVEQSNIAEVASMNMVFDIPLLVGKSLADLETTLGTPSYDVEPTQQQLALGGTDTWEKSWDIGEYSLMATYDIKTKEVIDLFLGADSDAAFKRFEDTNNILGVGNLSENNPRYSIEFVKAKNGPGYTGAIIRTK